MIAAAFNPLETEAASPVRALTKTVAEVSGSEQLTLEPLTEPDLSELLAQRFNVDASRVRDFAAFLHARTLGNPFFVEEMIKTLIQRGRLRHVDNQWVGWDVEDIDVPATIREVLLERVGALSPPPAIADWRRWHARVA
jgi:predicted ATPase